MDHPLHPALETFTNLLDRRLARRVFTTEDSVRYTFFVALLEALKLQPEDVVLEQPHPKIRGAQIDVFIPRLGERAFAIEFKYDRENPGGTNLPRPQKTGSMLHDVFRLAQFSAADKIEGVFVYVTSDEMAGYLRNPTNGLSDWFGLQPGAQFRLDEDFLSKRSKTLRDHAGPVTACDVTGLLSRSLANQHELRVYDVRCLE